jgi:NADH:ubiquinone oxidoreductase subunit 5 (subunit L)/multisubunit Na+/H+ antiporter MnhA subunit/multisubunit Na+/H+ antiporter MnhB subunit
MHPTWHLILAIFCPLIAGLATLLLPRTALRSRVAVALAGPVAAIALLAGFIALHGVGARPSQILWMPALNLNLALHADHLGLFFALLVSGIGLLITLYARAYFGPDHDSLYRFLPSLHLFMTAMLGVALADNFMLLLLFWELTSISSFLLIGWERSESTSVRNAMQAFIVTGLGGLIMMAGLILMGLHTGQWTFSGLLAIRQELAPDGLLVAAFLMIFVGAAAKSAQMPLHFWLPGAMAAPTPVSAYLHSATMVKAGVYLVGRMWPIFATLVPLWPQLIVPLGASTMVYGAFVAIQKRDLKQIFAYTTVSQLGLLMCMYGLAAFEYDGQPNLIWDITQILNHALYKAPLFILAGAIGHVASRDITELGGFFHRGRTERIMAVVLLLAAYAMAAGPFTISFTAKEFFFYQIYHGLQVSGHPLFWLLVAAGVATGMFNVAIFLRLTAVMLERPRSRVLHAMAPHGNGESYATPPPATQRHDETNPHVVALGHHGEPHAAHADEHQDHHGAHGHGDHHHETGLWPAFLWIPGLIIVAWQYLGGIVPGVYEMMFGWLERTAGTYEFHTLTHHSFPMTWDAFLHPGMPLYMSMAAMALGAALAISPLLRHVYRDPFDHVYPGFYALVTKKLGPGAFGLVQSGHAGWYVTAILLSLLGFMAWTVVCHPELLVWPADLVIEPVGQLLPGYLAIILLCVSALLMCFVQDRVSRVLILGVVGLAVTGVYVFYRAPDLTLTQLSIEIVSLILFLLVLSLLPRQGTIPKPWMASRIVLATCVGLLMFWLTLTSVAAVRPTMPYVDASGRPYAHLGEFFLRNSYRAQDLAAVPAGQLPPGVEPRGAGTATIDGEVVSVADTVMVHPGGGGGNVVNVILVDFRGFDTLGEITVLGLAALGVWTLLRQTRKAPGAGVGPGGKPRRLDDEEHTVFDPMVHGESEQAAAAARRTRP